MQIDKLNLEVGKTYSALMKGCEFDDLEGNLHVFEDEVTQIEIVEKPKYVMIDDGPNGELIKTKLTGHLLESHWYLVKILVLERSNGSAYYTERLNKFLTNGHFIAVKLK